jgi:predicted RNase H-like nuclease
MRTREQIETHLATIMMQINECNRVIKMAEEARRRREELRQELAQVAAEYAETADKVEIHIIR